MVDEYARWIQRSRAVIVTEYTGMTMPQFDVLRAKIREAGGEFHVVKNTLGKIAIEKNGMKVRDEYFEGSTAIGFAFEDAPALAKIMTDYTKTVETLKIKGGYLGASAMTPAQVKALADLPPLPVVRAQLLGVLLAPASKLARTIAEPGRQIASVLKAYADKDNTAAAPAAEAA
jgi:large subunit ribosomal protein L10